MVSGLLQINGMDVQNREEAVAILSQEENTNISHGNRNIPTADK